MKIRIATPADSKKTFDAHMKSIREVCSQDYKPEQIEAWGGRDYFPEYLSVVDDTHPAWVICDGKEIYGHCILRLPSDSKTAELRGLYIVRDALGKGFGRKLIELAKDAARKSGHEKLFADSTTTAKNFYESQGFVQTGPENNCMINGVPIEGFPMEFDLKKFSEKI